MGVKKLCSFFMVLTLLFSITGFCFAVNPEIETQEITVETLEDGTVVETVFTVYRNFARAQTKSVYVTKNYN